MEDRAAPTTYEFGLSEESFEGQRVAYLRSIVQQARSFGAFCQTIAAEEYRGKRIRFSAALKANNVTDGWGGLWLRIDGARLDETRAIDTMEDRPLWARPAGGSTMRWCWTSRRRRPDLVRCRIVWEGGAAGDAASLRGSRRRGAGDRRPHRPRQPQNLDFSHA